MSSKLLTVSWGGGGSGLDSTCAAQLLRYLGTAEQEGDHESVWLTPITSVFGASHGDAQSGQMQLPWALIGLFVTILVL